MQPNILITIAARGGSKGVKGKNIKEIAGKPLIAYTIDIAKRWGKAKHVVCTTDSEKIAEVAKKFGAEVPFLRPQELSSDTSGKVQVIRHAWKESQKIYSEKYDVVVDLDVTAPIRKTSDLDKCLALFTEKNPEILFSVVNAKKNPYFNMVEDAGDGFVKISKELNTQTERRQDAPKVYEMNASIYFYSIEFLADETKNIVTSPKRTVAYVMDDISSVDIDNELDFRYIEYLIKEGVVII